MSRPEISWNLRISHRVSTHLKAETFHRSMVLSYLKFTRIPARRMLQIRTYLVTFLPVGGGWIAIRDARYHNGVFQPCRHINHLLVYHRWHGAAYLCKQKNQKRSHKSSNDSILVVASRTNDNLEQSLDAWNNCSGCVVDLEWLSDFNEYVCRLMLFSRITKVFLNVRDIARSEIEALNKHTDRCSYVLWCANEHKNLS